MACHPYSFIAETFAETGTLEGRADHSGPAVCGGIDNSRIGYALVFALYQSGFDVERGEQRAVFTEALETVTLQHRLECISNLMPYVTRRDVHLSRFRFQVALLRVRPVPQPEIRFQFPAGCHGAAVLIGVTDFSFFTVHADTHDVDMRIVRVAVPVHDIRLISVSHFLHIPCRQFFQLYVSQPVFRCGAECDMQDGLLSIAVRKQVVLERKECKAYVRTRQSEPVGNHAVAGKDFGSTCRHLAVVVGKRPVKACAVTYLCNHFLSYSWVNTTIFLQRSISSTLDFSSL